MTTLTETVQEKPQTEIPIIPGDLTEKMSCTIVTNEQSQILVMHDKALPTRPVWAEYDFEMDRLELVSKDGHLENLGIKLTDEVRNNLRKAQQIIFALFVDGKQKRSRKVPFDY